MEKKEAYHINISAPDLLCICVDDSSESNLSGRVYHCYSEKPQSFMSVMQLLNIMEKLFDSINYPQASTRSRYFIEPERKEPGKRVKPEKVATQKSLLDHRGDKGTFIVYVQYRQNSDWQGEISWQERQHVRRFRSTLDLIKLITNALGQG